MHWSGPLHTAGGIPNRWRVDRNDPGSSSPSRGRFTAHPLVPLGIFRTRTLSGANLALILLVPVEYLAAHGQNGRNPSCYVGVSGVEIAVRPGEKCGLQGEMGHVSRAHRQQPNVLRVSGAHSLRDESSSRRPLDALVGRCRHVLRPISSRTLTSRGRFATADHPGPDRGSRQGAGRAASGTRAARRSPPRRQERLHAPP